MRSVRVPPVARTVAGASALTTLGTIPVFLFSAQAVFIRSELDFDELRFGLAVSAFFASAALAAFLGGGLVDRLGRRRSTMMAGVLAAAGGLGMAWATYSWAALVALMVVLGTANAACQVTANLTLARAVPPHRRGLGFGVKQAAIPLSIVIAGLAVPVVGAAVGWRWSFTVTGLAGVVVLATGLRIPRAPSARANRSAARDRPPMSALLAVMAAMMLASAAANSLGSFVALWGFEVGLTPSQAGLLMAAGSALNIVVRVFSGHRADLRHGRNLPIVAAQLLVGAVSLAALSVASPWTVVPAALLAFGLGWSWPGLLLYAVVRIGRDSPAVASGIVQGGAFVGGAAGPVLFGVVVGTLGYATAWRMAALLFLGAALLVLVSRRLFIADLVARPPQTPIGYGGGRGAPAHTTPRTDSSTDDDAS
jgi:MFS family permease